MNYLQFNIEVLNEEDSDAWVALLEETGYIGCEQKETELVLYYEENSSQINTATDLLNKASRNYSTSLCKAENWNKTWESNFEPVVIDDQIGIRAHFHSSLSHLPFEIVITPKMSFGTGHHATTQLMLSRLLPMEIAGQQVLDFGCGTGILAIMAKLKGAALVIGTDHDPWCIENSIENAQHNHCLIDFRLDDLSSVEGPFHLILANINLNILKENMKSMHHLLHPSGSILMSGILETDVENLTKSVEDHGMKVTASNIKNGWACFQVERR